MAIKPFVEEFGFNKVGRATVLVRFVGGRNREASPRVWTAEWRHTTS
jgi:hypothetical protein